MYVAVAVCPPVPHPLGERMLETKSSLAIPFTVCRFCNGVADEISDDNLIFIPLKGICSSPLGGFK